MGINIWEEVLKLVEGKTEFHTLGRTRKFNVVKTLPNGLMLKVGRGTQIEESRSDFEKVWAKLKETGKFDLMDIRDNRDLFSFNRPAYIPAILAELDFIETYKERRRTGIKLRQ